MIPTDVGAFIAARPGGASTATAGGAGDNAEVSGPFIDRQGYSSAKLVITYRTTLAQGATLAIAANLQDATDGAGAAAADFGDQRAATTAATGAAGGSTEQGTVSLDFNLQTAQQFIRAQFTPNLSAANTDTAIVAAVIILGGAVTVPAV